MLATPKSPVRYARLPSLANRRERGGVDAVASRFFT